MKAIISVYLFVISTAVCCTIAQQLSQAAEQQPGVSTADDPATSFCTFPPSVSAPQFSLGWRLQACNSTASGSVLSCSTRCKRGYDSYPPGTPNPVTTCDQATGEWSPLRLFCIHADPQSNCDTSPTIPKPANTVGSWMCGKEGAGISQIKTCTFGCAANYVPGPLGPPTTTCQYGPGGFWQVAKGACVAAAGPGQDVELPADSSLPPNTAGWSQAQCMTAKDAHGDTVAACVALCREGYHGRPHDPTALSVGSLKVWGDVTGACVATRQSEKPCYGFPTGNMRLPIQDGSNAYWDASCGGNGFCWEGDTNRCGNSSCCSGCTRNCGHACNTFRQGSGYCMGAIASGRVCRAVCTNGASTASAPRWQCLNGVWRDMNGRMCETK